MKLTIDLDKIVAKVTARHEREAWLRRHGVFVFRDWLKPKPSPKVNQKL